MYLIHSQIMLNSPPEDLFLTLYPLLTFSITFILVQVAIISQMNYQIELQLLFFYHLFCFPLFSDLALGQSFQNANLSPVHSGFSLFGGCSLALDKDLLKVAREALSGLAQHVLSAPAALACRQSLRRSENYATGCLNMPFFLSGVCFAMLELVFHCLGQSFS